MAASKGAGQKRHRAAALQDAGAFSRTPFQPRGFGVRQPYAAFAAMPPARELCSHPYGSCNLKIGQRFKFLRTLLVLGRVSNLPTVWSNCLAGWWLGGGGNIDKLPFLLEGATFLYTGGMF